LEWPATNRRQAALLGPYPSYSRGERIADNCIHALGVSVGLIGAVVLAVAATRQDNALLIPGVLLYGLGLIAMLGFSALYNITRPSPRKALFRRLDHAAIFVMIAGSYTPFALNGLGGAWGHGLLAFVWLVALAGAALKLFAPRRVRRFSTALYLLLGWSGLVALEPLFGALPMPALFLLATGGALYSLGVVFHHWQRLPYQNAIWHGLVLAAAGCHYGAILGGVVLAGGVA
jgi:hemolysin III